MSTGKFLGLDVNQIARGLKSAYDRHLELEDLRTAADLVIASARPTKSGDEFRITKFALEALRNSRKMPGDGT